MITDFGYLQVNNRKKHFLVFSQHLLLQNTNDRRVLCVCVACVHLLSTKERLHFQS